MLSRGIAGMIGDTLVLTFPGSTGGAVETYEALFPAVLHLFQIMRQMCFGFVNINLYHNNQIIN